MFNLGWNGRGRKCLQVCTLKTVVNVKTNLGYIPNKLIISNVIISTIIRGNNLKRAMLIGLLL